MEGTRECKILKERMEGSKVVLEEAGNEVVEDGEAVGEVTGIEEMKESYKLRRRNSTKVKLNVTGVSRWDTSHQSVPQKTNNST